MSEILTAEQVSAVRKGGHGALADSKGGTANLCDSHEALRAENERLRERTRDRDFQFKERCKLLSMINRVRESGFDLEPFTENTPERLAYDPLKLEAGIAELEKERDALRAAIEATKKED